jgi:hypothetical protein
VLADQPALFGPVASVSTAVGHQPPHRSPAGSRHRPSCTPTTSSIELPATTGQSTVLPPLSSKPPGNK